MRPLSFHGRRILHDGNEVAAVVIWLACIGLASAVYLALLRLSS